MSTCPNCNNNIPDGTAFCPKCGTNVVQQPVNQQFVNSQPMYQQNYANPQFMNQQPMNNMGGMRKLHCPQCKSINIQITTESSVNGALTTSHGNMSATSVSNTHRNFWICQDCGTKFRNIQNLEEEIAKLDKQSKICIIPSIIAAVLCIFFIVMIMQNPWSVFIFGAFTFMAGIVAIVCTCFIFVYKGRANKMRAELAYLKQNCFN